MSSAIDLSVFDDVEIMPVFENKEEGYCEPVLEPGEPISFWTVYGHLKEGGVTALIDCADEHSAGIAAFILERALRASELAAAVSPLICRADYVISAMDIGQNISDAEIEALSEATSKAEGMLAKLETPGE